MNYQLMTGDCLEELKKIGDESVDSLVTDPPAGISFRGKEWDGDKGGRKQWVAWMAEVMTECLRVMKPGAHGLVWALPRTSHWTATALEDAGFEVRDVVTHLFGTGFPKGLDISKAIDKAAGAIRVTGPVDSTRAGRLVNQSGGYETAAGWSFGSRKITIDPPATDAAKQWDGWGTALKPASEHWILIRKPCSEKTVVANVLKHGVGGINIDASRITSQDGAGSTRGRFPANLILDEEAAALLDEQSGINSSRFFYCAKPSRSEKGAENTHPTVKSKNLMPYLIKLVTPPGGVVLDPFMGSGTTGVSALENSFLFIGIEKDSSYHAIATTRIQNVTDSEACV